MSYVMEKLDELTDSDKTIIYRCQSQQMWAAQYYHYTSTHTDYSVLGTMGYGLGASLGVQVGCPDKRVINIAGDGCFRMNMNELATASRYNIPIIEVIINNQVLGNGSPVVDVILWKTLFADGTE